ncbi:MAG: alpha-L-rhamnosidase N-terminal domain-containing protein [Firmicutes bacterium]|nr:alpha-L-rhamnosidase N-terminal domain-containing protein [Bacillota bacterium]
MKHKGDWIWWTASGIPGKQAAFFRRSFSYAGGAMEVKLSAAGRCKLYVNGQYLCCGPQKGDRFRRYYDTVDITPWLREGKNTVAVHVLFYPNDYLKSMTFETGPVSVVGASRGGLWLSCGEADISTDSRWKSLPDASYGFAEAEESKYAGDMERCDGNLYPRGWNEPDFDDSGWTPAAVLCPADTHRLGGVLYEWQLCPRTLPMLYEKPIAPVGISKQSGADFEPLLRGEPVTVPPGTEAFADLDMGELVNAYVRLPLNAAGGGAVVTLEYAEGYRTPDGSGNCRKDIRDNAETGILRGEKDTYLPAPGSQAYEPFHFRVFRYLRLRIVTGEAPVEIRMPAFRLTGYPLEKTGSFRAENPELNRMWQISVRTLERCMLDTYVDCPYYEQMQYIMDTVIEALLTYQISADDRLARRAIDDFHATRRPDGMIHCNAPAAFDQIIPAFALYYVDLLYYHYQYFGDRKLLRTYLPTVSGILRYFLERVDPETGLLGSTGYWSFVDWVDQWRPNHGSPVADPEEPLYLYSHILAYALGRAEYLFSQVGWADEGGEYGEIRRELIRRLCGQTRDGSGYYRVSPSETVPSQHAQLWAVLSGCAVGEEAKTLMRRCMTDPGLLQCSYSMSFYLFRAMEAAGIYDEIPGKWRPWREMMEKHLTTWMEDAVSQRSDCHGWSAIPMYDLIAVVLGVRPEAPGYEQIRIRPMSPELGGMEATVATVRGAIHIRRAVRREDEGWRVFLNVSLPSEIPVRIDTGSKCVSFCQKEIAFDYKI